MSAALVPTPLPQALHGSPKNISAIEINNKTLDLFTSRNNNAFQRLE